MGLLAYDAPKCWVGKQVNEWPVMGCYLKLKKDLANPSKKHQVMQASLARNQAANPGLAPTM